MKLIRNLFLLLLALLVIALLLLAFLPARLATDFVGGRLGPLHLGEVSGSLWRGQANPVQVSGENIGVLAWDLKPLALFTGRIEADLSLSGDAYNGRSAVSLGTDRSVRVRDLALNFPARRMEPVLDIPALVMRGEIQVQVERAELRGGFPNDVRGRATWKNAAVAGSAEAQFGEVVTEFESIATGGIKGTVSDNGGPLQAAGDYQASLLGYDAVIDLRARDNNPQVIEALQYIGAPQADGSSRLEIRGRLLDAF